jgi:kinesin family protein C1
LSTEKALVADLENEISHLQRILEEKERYLESFKDAADDKYETFRKEKLSLEKQMNIKDEDLLFVEKEMEELTRTINDLEAAVKHKSNVIRKSDKEIAEKEREVREAIEESNRLRLKIDTLQQQHSETMVEDKEMSMKIEILEDELVEKENAIMNLRKKNTMTREEIEEELGKITKGQEKKLDDQTAMLKQQNEKIDFLADALMKVLKSQEKK